MAHGQVEILKQLAKHDKVNIDKPYKSGQTATWEAEQNGKEEAYDLLKQYGANYKLAITFRDKCPHTSEEILRKRKNKKSGSSLVRYI